MQYILDMFFYFRSWLINYIIFFSIRLYALEYTFDEVKKRSKNCNFDRLRLDYANDIDGLLSLAKDCLKDAIDRRAHVNDKTKTLIALNSALLAILTIFFPKIAELNLWWIKISLILGIICLINAIIMTWMHFDVQESMYISLDQNDVGLNKDDLKKSLINAYCQCCEQLNNKTDFLVDLYKTSRFSFFQDF